MTDALQQVPLTGGPIAYRGALEVVATEAGVLPRRLPQWTVAQYPEESMERQATAGSGVRLAFRTAATAIELDVLTTVPMFAAEEQDPDDAGSFEITIDGVPSGIRRAPVGNVIEIDVTYQVSGFVPGSPATVRFDGLPATAKEIEIWLPHWVKTEIVALRTDAPTEQPASTGRRVWLHHG